MHKHLNAKPVRPHPLAPSYSSTSPIPISKQLKITPPTLAEGEQGRGILKGEGIAKSSVTNGKFQIINRFTEL
jgi:hypothetical protein